MKDHFVNALQDGDTVNDYFVAARKDLRNLQNGGKFLCMVFKDRTGEIGAVMWNNAESAARLFEVGDVVKVRGTVSTYQERLQVRVDQVLPLKEGEYDLEDLVFVHEASREFDKAFRALFADFQNEWLARLVNAFLEDESFMKAFTAASAAKKWHHAHRGGLLRHCYEVARIALTVCELYPNINRELLLTGVFLHDIGKLHEMSQDLCVDYTTEGKLLGHLIIGMDFIQKRIDGIPGFPPELRMELLHCILAHHGALELGSPIVPKTVEAVVLHLSDNLDAQADAFTRVIEENRNRNQEWSEYITLIDRQIWSGKG